MKTSDLLILAALMLCAAAPAGRPVTLTPHPGPGLAAEARKLAADDLKSAQSAQEVPVLLVGSARLGTSHGPAALFVQVQSPSLCGSAGCSTTVYVRHGRGWKRVLDSVSGPIEVSPSSHGGMHDLLVHRTDRWVWNGSVYQDTLPAPVIDLKPGK